MKRRLGPAVFENGPDADTKTAPSPDPLARAKAIEAAALERAAARTAVADPPAADEADALPEIPTGVVRKTLVEDPPPAAPLPPVSPAIDADYEATRDRVMALGPKARAGDAEATAELNQIAVAEFARAVPRAPIVKRLNGFGIGRPET